MLVLTRRLNERIVIGGDVVVTVTAIGDGRVKLGIEAPPDVRIDRTEVRAKIEASAGQQPAPAE